MAEKAAEIHTLAPRVDWLEQAFDWMKDNSGEGGGTLDERLWRATVTGAETSGSWSPDPWTQTDLIYGPDSPNGLSLHQTIFGNNAANAMKTQDGKGFFGWLFPGDETRWQYPQQQTFANEVFGLPDSGYVHALRAANLDLATAIFKDVSYVGNYTVMDRILDQATELEELATNVEAAVGELSIELEFQITAINTAIDNINAQLVSIRNRLTAGGL